MVGLLEGLGFFVCFLFGRDTEPGMFLPNEKQEEIVWYLKSICSLQKGERPSYSPGHVRNKEAKSFAYRCIV